MWITPKVVPTWCYETIKLYDQHDRPPSAIGVMSSNPQIPTGAAFAWRLAAFYAALFTALGVQLPFLPVWLAAKGLDADMIGIVLAIPMIVRVFAIPLTTRRADRHDALRMAIQAHRSGRPVARSGH